MPNRSTHVTVGVVAGMGAGLVTGRSLPSDHQAIHVVFAGIGGGLGGAAPDILEPATSPNHRDLFHSLLAGGGLGAAWIADWMSDCHRHAAECEGRVLACAVGSPDKSREEMKALFWRALAGLIVGFIAGYASHLVLDAATKRSLPLLTNGF